MGKRVKPYASFSITVMNCNASPHHYEVHGVSHILITLMRSNSGCWRGCTSSSQIHFAGLFICINSVLKGRRATNYTNPYTDDCHIFISPVTLFFYLSKPIISSSACCAPTLQAHVYEVWVVHRLLSPLDCISWKKNLVLRCWTATN